MHLSVRLPQVEPDSSEAPTNCPLWVGKRQQRRCTGRHFKLPQGACDKPLRDLRHSQVRAQRYRCLICQRTCRVYPRGVSAAQQSNNLKALSVLLYVLGLSYQGVSDLLDALGQPVASPFARSRETRATEAPSRASPTAVGRPMPLEAPVTTAVLPARGAGALIPSS